MGLRNQSFNLEGQEVHSEDVQAHPNSHTPMCTPTQHPHIHPHNTHTHPHSHPSTYTHTDDEDLGQNFRISFHHSNGLCCSISAQTRKQERFKNISVKGHRLISLQLPSTAKSDDIISTGLCEAHKVF